MVAALDAYRNVDGGYGWALEPDHRSSTSQPVAAMHALEVLADLRDVTSSRPVEICDWLAEHTLTDGGVPFGLPFPDAEGSAGHWTAADATTSSVQMGGSFRLGRSCRSCPIPDSAEWPGFDRARLVRTDPLADGCSGVCTDSRSSDEAQERPLRSLDCQWRPSELVS